MLQLQPGDVPCFILLSGMQVPRVIGKGGALIRELREESGATVDILDRQLPNALQASGNRMALIKGSDTAMHAAITGLVRNLNGPQAARLLEPSSDGVAGECCAELLVPEQCEPYVGDEKFLDGIGCAVAVAAVDGLPRHRKACLRSSEVAGLQAAAWRVHELVLRLVKVGSLSDNDFDLQDAAWDVLMASLQRRRSGGDAKPPQGTPGKTLAALQESVKLPEMQALEAQALAAQEAKAREMSGQQERDRRAKVRETQARQARERELRARESRAFAAQARDLWDRCANLQDGSREREKLSTEARRLDMLSRDAWSRTIHGAGELVPQEEPLPQPEEPAEPAREDAAPSIDRRDAEQKFHERTVLQRQAEEAQARERQFRAAAAAAAAATTAVAETPAAALAPATTSAKGPAPRPGSPGRQQCSVCAPPQQPPVGVASFAAAHGGNLRTQPTITQPADLPCGRQQDHGECFAATGSPPAVRVPETAPADRIQVERRGPFGQHVGEDTVRAATRMAAEDQGRSSHVQSNHDVIIGRGFGDSHGDADGSATCEALASGSYGVPTVRASPNEVTFPVLLPNLHVASFLSSGDLGIAFKTGAKLSACGLVDGTAILHISGPPIANAVACYYVQEALWMSGRYSTAQCGAFR